LNPLDDKAILLKNSKGRPVAGSDTSEQWPLRDFEQEKVQSSAGDAHPPVRPVDPVADVILAVRNESGDVPDKSIIEKD